jgi:SPP1 family predicted phage head-tail adaptor
MLAGPLNRRITLRRATVTTNEFGEDVEAWRDLATVWAQRTEAALSVLGSERVVGSELASSIVSTFRIRWSRRLDITPRDRVSIGGREHNIVSVIEIGLHEGLEITTQVRDD